MGIGSNLIKRQNLLPHFSTDVCITKQSKGIRTLTLKQKIGQKLVSGFEGTSIPEDFVKLVKEYYVGNVILFAHNLKSREQTAELCGQLQSLIKKYTGHNAFICIDQEGGRVTRLPAGSANIAGAMAIAATDDPENALTAGRITGKELKRLGINFNLAPVLDINSNPENPVIGVRSYGDKPETIVRFALPMAKGLMEEGVFCAGKHFPGHGDTDIDSHLALPSVDKPIEELCKTELAPFIAAIEAGIPAIISSHILFPSLDDSGVPATMSRPILTGLLKEKLGFEGLVLTDGMEMNAIKNYYGVDKGCVEAVKAGADLVFICHSPSMTASATAAILRSAENGEIDLDELDRSVKKVLTYKETYVEASNMSVLEEYVNPCEEIQKVIRCSLTPVNLPDDKLPPIGARPVFFGPLAYRHTMAVGDAPDGFNFPEYLAARLGGTGILIPQNPGPDDVIAAAESVKDASCLIIGIYDGYKNKGQLNLAEALIKTGIPTIVVALNSPYDLRGLGRDAAALAIYEYSCTALDVLSEALEGQFTPTGKLSVQL